jgi:hypothetical protein
MVKVPQYEGPQVRPTPLRAEQSIRAPEAAFGGATAQAFSQAGKEFGQVASLLDKRVEERGKEDAELQAWNAYTAASAEQQKLFYQGDDAIYNRRGGRALGSANEAALELRRLGDETSKTLTSPYAQQNFQKLWARNQDSEMGAVSRYERDQRREYADQTTAGVLANSQSTAALRFNDENEVTSQIEIGSIAIRGNSKGLPPDQVQAHIKTFTSGVRKAVVLRRMLDDPLGADAYFREHANDFEPDDIVTVERALKVKTTQAKGRAEATRIEAETTVDGPTTTTIKTEPGQPPVSRTFAAQVQMESGGRQADANGKLIVSPTGNYGITQINDASGEEAAKALNIPWNRDLARGTTDEAKAYNLKLGQQYMQMKLDDWGGNETLALAAYHAGSGNVAQWVKDYGDPREGKISEAAWLAKIPGPKTRQYVSNVQASSKGESRIDLDQAYRKIDEIQDPEVQDQARIELERSVSQQNRVRTEKQRVARDRAQDLILGGARFEDVPGEILAEMEPTAQQALRNFSESVRKNGDVVTDPETRYRLSRMAGEDMAGFAKYDLRGDWDKLSTTDKNHFEELQRQYLAGGVKAEASSTGERTRVQIADQILNGAGIDTTPKPGTVDANRIRIFNDALDRNIRAWKVQNEGKQPNSDDIRKMADQLVISGVLRGSGTFRDTRQYAFETTPEQAATFEVEDVAKIPPESATRMRAAFKKANGGRDPTDAELLSDFNEYLQSRLTK